MTKLVLLLRIFSSSNQWKSLRTWTYKAFLANRAAVLLWPWLPRSFGLSALRPLLSHTAVHSERPALAGP